MDDPASGTADNGTGDGGCLQAQSPANRPAPRGETAGKQTAAPGAGEIGEPGTELGTELGTEPGTELGTEPNAGPRGDWAGADDAALLAAVARSDRTAFVALFHRYAGRIKGFLIRSGAPAGLAEEMTQEIMVTLWRRAASFDPEKAAASTWIFTIARNRRIDLARRSARLEVDGRDPTLFDPEPASSAEQDMAGHERDALVRRAVQSLGEEQREVVRLAFFSGMSHGEIAEALDLPLGTVKSRLRLAFTRLREALGDGFAKELHDD